ncbi:LCP family protein [Enterococcus raffinosus]|uniref:LCP family protein n=1 Tax=Enterococcus raffinosus TaxID=71452 RepID=A0AAW8SUI4_9ENTE|nr:LCP family protein [Enterococcus raffinosus]MBS6430164.1 LCP family protein [Enterococcus raffinosus]MDK7989950.1 LCP family protein [Enterococcus raffinosus]MDT2538498.1 LCP family protein [Enterococcus raffinosus]MDT2573198.1 LCP family protein [Enterococcus raffinosus]UXJ97755.1 LCP family protein [Enterococcus raffinosus]
MKRVQKIILLCLTAILMCTISVSAYFLLANQHLKKALANGYHPIKNEYQTQSKQDSEAFLIMGLDNTIERKLGTTRTDAMMVITINNKTKKLTFCSLPRDSFVPIEAKNYHGNQRIEAAYTFGGPTASVNTVEKLLKIPIAHYCVFNFLSFIQFIDAIGGIDINVQHSFDGVTKDGPGAIHFDEGKQHVDGTKALSYARERHSDNDIMRGFRQQEIIQAVGKKLKSKDTVKNLTGIIDSFDNNIQTNITGNQLITLMKNSLAYSDYDKQRLTFDWRTFSNQGRSMVELYPDSIRYVSHELRVSLGIDKKNEQDKKDFVFQTNGNYLYQSDYSVQDEASEEKESTSHNGNTYIGTPGNTETGSLPTVKTKNGFVP